MPNQTATTPTPSLLQRRKSGGSGKTRRVGKKRKTYEKNKRGREGDEKKRKKGKRGVKEGNVKWREEKGNDRKSTNS